ncbi:hypothetical protein CISIN_1g046308mg, partial [Citrus sinensis]
SRLGYRSIQIQLTLEMGWHLFLHLLTTPHQLKATAHISESWMNLPKGEDMHQIAVELDAYKNDFDLDGNHVAIDIKSVRQPVALESLNSTGVDLKSGRNITVRIECNGWQNLLYVNVHYADHPPKNVIKQPINISDIVPSSVYVGFTAATGAFSESHQLLEWSLTSLQSVR